MPTKVIRVKDEKTARRHVELLLSDGYKCRVFEDESYATCEKLIEKHGDLIDIIIIEWLY